MPAEPTGEILVTLLATDTGPAREWADAARADQVAAPRDLPSGEVRAVCDDTQLPSRLTGTGEVTIKIRGLGAIGGVNRLRLVGAL